MTRPAQTPFSPTQSARFKMAAARLRLVIADTLAGLHHRGGAASTGACLHERLG